MRTLLISFALTLGLTASAEALHNRYHYGTHAPAPIYSPPPTFAPSSPPPQRIRPWEPQPGDSLLRPWGGGTRGRSLMAPPSWGPPPAGRPLMDETP